MVFIHLVTMWQGSWAGAAALYIEVESCYTGSVLALHSMHQLAGFKYAVKPLCTPFGCIYAVFMSIDSHIQLYIHAI